MSAAETVRRLERLHRYIFRKVSFAADPLASKLCGRGRREPLIKEESGKER